ARLQRVDDLFVAPCFFVGFQQRSQPLGVSGLFFEHATNQTQRAIGIADARGPRLRRTQSQRRGVRLVRRLIRLALDRFFQPAKISGALVRALQREDRETVLWLAVVDALLVLCGVT